ncbi:hypothetical protein M2281_005585 [Mesorhizobium soli]|uniref:hypothetical protein n=1 Tax=Pseudaminobacter soli (ex Li et al. 2025) TaxID=1295366 RepID=UPI0024731506|nr:hypothetical protein [Mesorhizobium soli]MDH6234964.1 hypothetical protein [Mesorhizobium soli]
MAFPISIRRWPPCISVNRRRGRSNPRLSGHPPSWRGRPGAWLKEQALRYASWLLRAFSALLLKVSVRLAIWGVVSWHNAGRLVRRSSWLDQAAMRLLRSGRG